MALLRVKAGIPQAMDADDNPTFERWLQRVDAWVWRAIGLSVHDLEDMPFQDWYEERLRPIRAANKAIKRAGADR